jgi:hypothetical protein
MSKPSCKACQNFHHDAKVHGSSTGECRFLPPQMTHLLVPTQSIMSASQGLQLQAFGAFPLMEVDQWCGQYATKLALIQ